jgi:hypothetical protein
VALQLTRLIGLPPHAGPGASGVTAIARSLGAAVSPPLAGVLLGVPALVGVPFLLSGGLKIVYDLLLFRSFRRLKPPEEAALNTGKLTP